MTSAEPDEEMNQKIKSFSTEERAKWIKAMRKAQRDEMIVNYVVMGYLAGPLVLIWLTQLRIDTGCPIFVVK
jgi:hypothetical protein